VNCEFAGRLALFIFLLCGGSVVAQQDMDQYEASGPVKSIDCRSLYLLADDQQTAMSRDAHSVSDSDADYIVRFNEHGQLLSRSLQDAAGKTTREETFLYEDGRLASWSSGVETSLFSYDADGLLTLVVSKTQEDALKIFCHSENGRETQRITVNEQGDTVQLLSFLYDTAGRVVTEKYTSIDPLGEYYSNSYYSYDADGNLLEASSNGEYGLSSAKMTYENGLLKTRTECYTYDSQQPDMCTETTYDKGLATSIRRYDLNRSSGQQFTIGTQHTSYIFDERGNWTQKTLSDENGAFLLVKRTITYY
jgi:hypothetical protein